MVTEPRIASIATAVPKYLLRQEDVLPAAASHFQGNNARFERLMPVYRNAQIDTRYSCVPLDWYGLDHGFAERNELYLSNAVDLLATAACEAVEAAELTLQDIDGLVVVSSTGIATPSLDALVMERLDLRRDIRFLSDGEFLTVMKKTKSRPWALAGGLEPEANSVIAFAGTEREMRMSTKRVPVKKGDRVTVLTAGGGGHGDPKARDPKLVEADLAGGFITPKAARDIYGWTAGAED